MMGKKTKKPSALQRRKKKEKIDYTGGREGEQRRE